jgi:hypothetical protein
VETASLAETPIENLNAKFLGRIGSVLAPMLGGYLLSIGLPGWLHTKQRLNHDPLEFIQADLVAPAIVELRCARGKHGSP